MAFRPPCDPTDSDHLSPPRSGPLSLPLGDLWQATGTPMSGQTGSAMLLCSRPALRGARNASGHCRFRARQQADDSARCIKPWFAKSGFRSASLT